MRLATILIIFFAIPAICFAQTTWYVPDDFSTIQGAISDSTVVNGDTIIIRSGTYFENIDFLGKAITVQSSEGPDMTFIDGGNPTHPYYGSCVLFASGEGPDSVLMGFTLTRGTGTWDGGFTYGGGIYCVSSSPTIINNKITANMADGGGGVCCLQSDPEIRNNTLKKNAANYPGGGIYCYESSPIIADNIVAENTANTTGGGISCWEKCSPYIINNVITGNAVVHDGGGISCDGCSQNLIISNNIITENMGDWAGGIYCYYSDAIITNNFIFGNIAEGCGGGIACEGFSKTVTNNIIAKNIAKNRGGGIYSEDSTPTIINNTIFENTATNFGGGITSDFYSSIFVSNNILWDNGSSVGPAISIHHQSTVTINYSNVMNGQYSCYVDTGCTLNWSAGMIDADPLFVDPVNDDFHLTHNSPCRDTGDNSVITELYDFEGDPRIAEGKVDMGADEFYPHLYLTGSTTPTGNVEIKFIGLPGDLINGLLIGVNIFDPPLPCDYGLWYMDNPFQIMTGFGTIPADGVKVFPGTIPGTTPAPLTVYLQAAIDSWLTNLCVVEVE